MLRTNYTLENTCSLHPPSPSNPLQKRKSSLIPSDRSKNSNFLIILTSDNVMVYRNYR